MKHGGVHSKSYSSDNEKGKGELLSFSCCGSTGSVYLGSSNGNLSVLGISSLGGDEITDKLFVGNLVGGLATSSCA